MVTELLQKYIWLVQTFIKSGASGLSFKELRSRWETRFGMDYPRRTFNNHREAVMEIFGISIECNRSTNRYFIRYTDDVTDDSAASAWLINTFTVNNILSLSKERLSGRVSVEDIPSGHKHLTAIMEAMLECCTIRIRYRKYTSEGVSEYTVRPYAIKEASRRWYLVAHCIERNEMRVYGLDRIISLSTENERFIMPEDFDVDALFSTSYGVYLPDGKPVEIIFRTSHKEAGYLRDLPIHHSQKTIRENGESVEFSISVCPNNSLIMDLWRLGSRIEILSPPEIREAFAAEAEKASMLYKR